MTMTPYAVGSIVFVRHQPQPQTAVAWPVGCWPGVVTEARLTPHGWDVDVLTCSGRLHPTTAARVAATPCAACAALWTQAGWQEMRRTG